MERFKLYLENKNKKFLRKEEIADYFKEFCAIWNSTASFEKVMGTLRKTSLTYLFSNYWAVSKENPLKLCQEFLTSLNVDNYYGLSSALYLNAKTWQPPLQYSLLNTSFTKKRTFGRITIQFIKIPKEFFNKETLIQSELTYSNYEKTILDMIFFKEQKFYQPEDFGKINLYIPLFRKYPFVRATLIEKLEPEKRGLIQ